MQSARKAITATFLPALTVTERLTRTRALHRGVSVYGGVGSPIGVRVYGDLGSINNNNWHHLVHVVDRAAGKITTYLDGAVAHSTKPFGGTVDWAGNTDTTNPTIIGQDPTGRYG